MSQKVLLKIIILGDSGVGKTSILHKYVNNRFIEEHKATIGAAFSTKEIMVDGDRLITLQLWDTAGQERFQSLGRAFYRGSDACILVYDITSQESFNRISTWRENFLQQSNPENPSEFPFLLFGNKCDLDQQRQVSTEQVTAYANKQKCMKFYETSALNGQNLEVGIRLIANIAAQMDDGASYDADSANVDLDGDEDTNGVLDNGCCELL
eukprot:204204_1